MQSEYTANLALSAKTEMDLQVEKNKRVRAEVARIRAEKARNRARKTWWRIW